MKRIISTAAAVLLMTSCSQGGAPVQTASFTYDTSPCDAPEQEWMFLITHEVYSDSPDITEAVLLTSDGILADVSDAVYDDRHERRDDWQERIPVTLTEKGHIPQEDLYAMYHFIADAEKYSLYGTVEYAEPEYDAGKRYLYALGRQQDGTYRQILLCTSGERNTYINDPDVAEFCGWMSQQGYYAMNTPFSDQ